MGTIPASELVSVTPSVLGVGGTAIDVIGLILSEAARVPIGSVQSFPDAQSVEDYFGGGSQEASLAATYFAGFNNASKTPASVLFAQYPGSAVAAFLRGGDVSALTLAQLQAISGSLDIVVDGYARNAASVNLSSATSFSSAAGIVQTQLNAANPTEASVTAQIGAAVTGHIDDGASGAGTILNVTAVSGGIVSVGDAVSGSGVTAGTVIVSFGTGTGGTGTYNVNNSQNVASESLTISSNVLDVTAVGSGAIAVGQTVTGSGVTSEIVTALGTGTGDTGTYVIAGDPQHVASESMTLTGTPLAVTYDSVSGAFVVTSGITGTPSTVAFATGTIAASLKMTSATGAVLSQGAAAAVPATFMDGVVAVTTDWVTFMTAFDPDGGSGISVREAFAAWKDTALGGDRFAYVCWDTDASPTTQNPATGSLGYALANNGDSGTALVWAPDATTGAQLAAFVCGAAASIDFDATDGRITFAYKAQSGITATVTDATTAQNLAGNPQTSSRGNGYNFYGAYAQANSDFTWFQRGFVTGAFKWLDSYVDQVWLNSILQNALLTLLGQAKAIPYTAAGQALIEQALAAPIQQGLNFGAYEPGAIDASQIAAVNQAAGADVAGVLQTQGWYLQVKPASSSSRAARTSPPCTFWYLDRGSVQSINLASVAVQ